MRLAPVLLAVLSALVACGREPQSRAAPPRIVLTSCRLEGSPVPAQCGTLDVPEDRKHPGGRTISLRVAVIPALASSPERDPLFLLAGGPGQAATRALGPLASALERVRSRRDLVLVDQRGTGASRPLDCVIGNDDDDLGTQLSARPFPVDRLRACLAGYDADPRFYLTSIAMQDLDDVRAALGYEQINLWGSSYGTRAALVYAREHAAHVRSIVLDGVAPPQMRVPLYFARDAERALSLLLDACEKEDACAKTFVDLRPRLLALLDRLAKEPARVTVVDPRTGDPQEVVISRDIFAGVMRGVLYAPELAVLVPLTIDRATKGDFGPFAAQAETLARGFAKGLSLGMMLSVLCSEDFPFISAQEIDSLSQGTFLGPSLLRDFAAACEIWPRGAPPADSRDAVRIDKPVLLLSGELDPVTPPSWAEEARKTLPNSLHGIAPGVGHGVTAVGCAPRLVARFIDSASVQGLDTGCLASAKRPPLFVSFAGPTP